MGWRDALHGRNKDVRADASEIIVGNPPKSAELTDTFDSERALKLLNTKAERGITREAMFILLCLQSNPDNAETLAQYFIRKEYAPYGAPSVSEQSYLIFKEFLVTNKVEPNQLFDNPSYLNNERIKSIIAELVSDSTFESLFAVALRSFFVSHPPTLPWGNIKSFASII